jgi:hypothetical protein
MARPKNPDTTVDSVCPTCKIEFTYKKYKPKKYCSKTCAANSSEVKEKNRVGVSTTFNKKYGGHAMKTPDTKEKFKSSMMKKYGKEYSMQIKSIQDKAKKTTVENYGVENVLSISSPLREKIRQTWIKKYGVDNPGKSEEVINRRSKRKQENHYAELSKFFDIKNLTWLIQPDQYEGYHFSKSYNFKCNKCGNTFDSTVYVPNNVFCELCHPEKKNSGENSLLEFLKTELNGKVISRHNRTILNGKELDFYIPELNFAIEYNGLYWHKESSRVSKNYHLDKTKTCEENKIKLVHIFENEWLQKQNIVKSIIRQMIGSSAVKIHGRECDIKKVDTKTKQDFLNNCHIQGEDKSSVAYGLFYKGTLVSIMTFCKSRFDKKCEWEISRFCNALNTKIHGGASKLFNVFLQDYSPNSIVSYSDRRYFSGDVYNKLGMTFEGYTAQGYHYISPDYKALFNRQMFQKNKLSERLEKFDIALSEWENMKNNGFDRIWDCGHSKWIYKPKIA